MHNSAGLIGPGIDVRGEGGYVLAPPSLQPCGGRYEWSVDSAAELATAPDWLIEALADPAKGKGKPLEHWHKTLLEPIPQGRRNTTLLSIAGKLLFHDREPDPRPGSAARREHCALRPAVIGGRSRIP